MRDPELSCRRCTTANILCTALVTAVKSPKSKVIALNSSSLPNDLGRMIVDASVPSPWYKLGYHGSMP
jgi:hypothetical protein